jgi:cyanobactin maturation PatA/PatG family protease
MERPGPDRMPAPPANPQPAAAAGIWRSTPKCDRQPRSEKTTVQTSACASCRGERQLVYALGRLGYDFGTEACRDAFTVRMRHWLDSERKHEGGPHHEANPLDEAQMVAFLRAMAEREPWHASALLWTLNLGGYPLYVVRPEGPFARDAYNRVRHFFDEQHEGEAERVAVPGDITGQATLLNGLKVPVINPDLRGLCNWNRCKLIQAVLECPIEGDQVSETSELERSLHEFLDRIYFEMQNAGRTARDRALNYAGTNLFHYRVIHSKLRHQTALDTIGAEPSTICRPGSDCWDITLAFFDPRQPLQTIRKIFRYTIDVSDALPVTVSDIRSWAARVA